MRLPTTLLCLWMCLMAASSFADPLVPQAGNPHGNINLDCKLCHSEDSWEVTDNSRFDHNTTGFSLAGNHKYAECRDCHQETVFANVGTQCADCHNDTHRGRLGPSCADCHTPEKWVDRARMRDEHSTTAMHMVGAHERVDCDACHVGAVAGDYVGTPTDCYACHQDVYDGTTDPNHASAGFGTDCQNCHGVFSATWGAGDFVHSLSFPLEQGHRGLECSACHGVAFAEPRPSTACENCHLDNFSAATNPDHNAAGFVPAACTSCHTPRSWAPSQYNHDTTGFVLEGQHRTLDCASCHSAGFAGTGSACVDCHQANYDNAANPNHVTAGFPTDCATCHTTNAWTPADFDHNTTGFPLTGAHANQDCLACHSTGFAGTASACVDCHQSNYDNAANPNHATAGFPIDCASCHTTNGWSPADFDHNATSFPLTGAHANQDCLACHSAGFSGTSSACVDCHQSNYDGTNNPNHASSNFPVSCQDCHTTSRWVPSTWDHDNLFPINSGSHRGQWNSCLDCHTVQSDFSVFECITCHEHNRTDVDGRHREVSGYSYVSSECFRCHPRGRTP